MTLTHKVNEGVKVTHGNSVFEIIVRDVDRDNNLARIDIPRAGKTHREEIYFGTPVEISPDFKITVFAPPQVGKRVRISYDAADAYDISRVSYRKKSQ